MALHPRRRRHILTVQGECVVARYRVLLRTVFWAILLLLTLTGLALTGGFHHATPIHAAPFPQSTPTCDTPTYHGVKHCVQSDVHTIVVDLADPHVRMQTVLPINPTGAECNSVNPVSKDPTSNCADPYPFETLDAMLARYKDAGAVAAINTDYFGCGVSGTPCGGPTGDHGAQGLAVRNGVRLDGLPHGVTNDLAYTTPSLAVSPLNLVTIGIPGSQAVINNRLDNRYYNTVGGSPMLIKDRDAVPNPCNQPYHAPYGDTCNAQADPDGNVIEAQSVAALSDDGTKLVLTTAGLKATDLADYLVTNGTSLTGGDVITSAIKFDGGGSARLAWRTPAGTIAAYSPTGQNRPIAQALLIFSDKITTKTPGIFPARLALAGAPGLSTTWALTVATGNAPIDKGDVMLVFDRTGSMADEIAQAQRSALDIMNQILEQLPNTRFGVAGFMDYPSAYSYPGYMDGEGSSPIYGKEGDLPWELNVQPTTDIAAVAQAINEAITLGNGADGPESYTRMLYELLQVQWRPDSKKIAVVFGDAPAHDLDFGGRNFGGDPGVDAIAGTGDDLDFETVVQQLRTAGITIIAVKSREDSEGATATFRGMSIGHETAVGTNGQYFELGNTARLPFVTTKLILDESRSVDELSLRVSEGFASWVTVAPTTFKRVGANAEKTFSLTIKPPPGTPAGFYPFLIQAIGDGAILGAMPVEVTVPIVGGLNDTSFRPSLHGYQPGGSASVQTWAMFRQFFGQAQVEYSNGNRLYAADRFFTDTYAKAGVSDSATGFAATSMINFAPSLTQPNAGPFAMPQTTNLFSVSNLPPTVSAAIAFAQGTPLGLEIAFQKANRCKVMEKSPAAMFFALRAQLQAGNPPLISLFNAEPTVGRAAITPERTLLPYRIEEPTLTSARVFVYDPAYPGNDTQVVEFRWAADRAVLDAWRYATPDGNWEGDRTACRLTVTPLSLFTHAGVAWWKVGPSWPPTVTTAAIAQRGGSSEQPPAVQLYRATGAVALLITDREGQRLGFDGTTFYDEIAGATFIPAPGDSMESSGLFYVPHNRGATAQLLATGAGDAALNIFGENYLSEVTVPALLTGTLATVAVDDVGEQVTVTALNNPITGRVGINRLLTAEDRTIQIGNLNLQPNTSAAFTFRPAQSATGADEIVLHSTNHTTQTVSLSLQRSGENIGDTSGYTVFGVDALRLTAAATLALQLDSWTTPTQVTAVITDVTGNVDTRAIVSGTLAAATVAFEPTVQTLHKKGDQLPLIITVRDRLGAYVADGTVVTMQTTRGNLSPRTATTVNGRVITTLTYEGSAGETIVTAQVGTLQAALAVTFLTPTGLPDEQEPIAPRDHHTYLPFVQR